MSWNKWIEQTEVNIFNMYVSLLVVAQSHHDLTLNNLNHGCPSLPLTGVDAPTGNRFSQLNLGLVNVAFLLVQELWLFLGLWRVSLERLLSICSFQNWIELHLYPLCWQRQNIMIADYQFDFSVLTDWTKLDQVLFSLGQAVLTVGR